MEFDMISTIIDLFLQYNDMVFMTLSVMKIVKLNRTIKLKAARY